MFPKDFSLSFNWSCVSRCSKSTKFQSSIPLYIYYAYSSPFHLATAQFLWRGIVVWLQFWLCFLTLATSARVESKGRKHGHTVHLLNYDVVKGVFLVVVSVLQLLNNLGWLVKPERKELKFCIFRLLCLF